MKRKFVAALLTILLFSSAVFAQDREEFNGPYNSWADVKKRFGAHGNGKDDDTKALQNAIDGLGNPVTGTNMGAGAYVVVYLPAGTYCISSTLQLKGKIGVSIIGEDPARTIIKWTAKDSGTMLLCNGSAYFKVARLTWDNGGIRGMEGIGVHWLTRWNNAASRSFATLNIELSDMIFTPGFRYGIGGGTVPGPGTGANDSEIAIKRCKFQHCTVSGVEIVGFNAIDYWIWDCSFLGCNFGIHCTQGTYHAYRCYFSGSTFSDVHHNQGYYVSVRGCYSENSSAFSLDDGMSCNPFKRIFQDNIIVRPKVLPVEFYHLGKITLMGNVINAALDTANRADINTKSWCPGIYEVLSLHNTYGYKTPVRIASNPQHLYSYGDSYNPGAHPPAAAFLKTMDKTPARVSRKVFEVPANADAAAIQMLIYQAAALKGQRPIIHFGVGAIYLDRPLIIPAGCDMQLTGDGMIYASMLTAKQPAPSQLPALLIVKGPSYISIRDLELESQTGGKINHGIIFQQVDQPTAQAHIDQLYSHADTTLYVNGLDHLYVEKDNSFFADGNRIIGGPLVQQGRGEAQVCCFGGQYAGLWIDNNASFTAKDCWWEGAERMPVNLDGSGNVTIDGTMIAPIHADSLPTIRVGHFSGKISLLNMYIQGGILAEVANAGLSMLVWNVHCYYKMNPVDFIRKGGTFKGAFIGINTQCFNKNDPACNSIASVPDVWHNVTDTSAFLDALTAQDRNTRPQMLRNLPAGVSNIYISRVTLGNMQDGILFGKE